MFSDENFYIMSFDENIDSIDTSNLFFDSNVSPPYINISSENIVPIGLSINEREDFFPKDKNENENKIDNSKSKTDIKISFMTENPNSSTIFTKGYFNNYTYRIFNEAKMINSKNIDQKKLIKKRRRDDLDEIRIKFIHKFFKSLIQQINKKLKAAGSKCKFEYIPRIFIKEFTNNILNKKKMFISEADLALETILSEQFCEFKKKLDEKRFIKNTETLEKLKKDIKICEKSNFDAFKVMKFSEIFKEYLYSKEFGKVIYDFKNKIPGDDEYIRNYIFRTIEFQKIFSK